MATDGIDIAGKDLKVVWKQQASSGFKVELCQTTSFAPRKTTVIEIDDINTFFTTTQLKAGLWYIRVLALAEGGYTEPSKVVQVKMGVDGGVNGFEDPTGVDDVQISTTPTKILENGHVYILRNGKRYTILGSTIQ